MFGGSLGARRLNDAALDAFGAAAPCAVLHACGRRDHDEPAPRASTSSARRRTTTCTPTSSRSPTPWRPPTWRWPAPAARCSSWPRPGCRRSWCPTRTPPPTTRPRTRATWSAPGAAVVVPDAELDGPRLAREVGALLARAAALAAMANAAARRGPARRRGADRRRAAGAGRPGIRSGRERARGPQPALHRDRRRRHERPGAGGPRARRRGHAAPTAPSRPTRERLRAAGHRARDRPRRRQPARGRRGGGVHRDRRGQPRAGRGPRGRSARCSTAATCWASCRALKRTIAVAGTHGKTTTASMAAHALRDVRPRPGLPDRRRAALARAPTRPGARASGWWSRPTSPTARSSSSRARWRWSPTSSSTTTPPTARWASSSEAFAEFAAPARPARARPGRGAARRRGARYGIDDGDLRADGVELLPLGLALHGGGRGGGAARCPAATTC